MQPDPPHGNVLVLVDDNDAGELIARAVAATGERPAIARWGADLPAGGADGLAIDLVITDRMLDSPASEAVLPRLLSGEIHPHAPRIHLFRTETARQELRRAVPDGLDLSMAFPAAPAELQVRIRLAAEVGRLRREIDRSATLDPATGLSNRTYFLRRLEEEFARAKRHRTALSLVVFDVDRLRRINDTFGWTTGDSVVQQFVEIVRIQVRKEDVAGRLNGATLAVLMPGNGVRGAAAFASKVRTDTEEVVLQYANDLYPVHVSSGITTFPDSPNLHSAEAMLRAAEGALAEAKSRGGNRVFIDEHALRHERRVVLVADTDPELLDSAEDLLTLDDYDVVLADSARAALETLRSRRPDLLVVDLHMAELEGGTPLIEQIQSLFPSGEFPIIGLSRDSGTSPEHLTRLGVDRFITKPFSVSLLRGVARELLEETRTP